MIDDPEKTALFISRLKELLPIDAGIAKDLQRTLAAKSPEIPIPARCQVVDVLNLGDEGGVACCLDIGGSDAAAAQYRLHHPPPIRSSLSVVSRHRHVPTPSHQKTQAAARPRLLTPYVAAPRSESLPHTDQMKRLFRVGP